MSVEQDEAYWLREFECMTINTSAFCGSKDPKLRKAWTRKLNMLFSNSVPVYQAGEEKLEATNDRLN
jgi:Ni,Fe-hydrogenase I small subunit